MNGDVIKLIVLEKLKIHQFDELI